MAIPGNPYFRLTDSVRGDKGFLYGRIGIDFVGTLHATSPQPPQQEILLKLVYFNLNSMNNGLWSEAETFFSTTNDRTGFTCSL